ncbi:FAST kinase domain-containing protein 5, mitochondrial [Holothuria leucospilota]|uniref:FAST kinase domain-containing protein 5, mitochondrial n=1 Tax=Holothuria leucospilota TaxID=206669 RepID=A0A9Q1H1W2_HOLLE|nr:FAST kinase domain-containing protein 5, mitochondrial [Holothuria leucospilota]
MNFSVMATHTLWWRTLCRVPSMRDQLTQIARVTICNSSIQALRTRTCSKQEQTNRFHRAILPFSDGCGYLVRNVHSTGLHQGVNVKSNIPIRMEADQIRTSQNMLEPIKVGLLQEKYHTIRTPRLFHLERQGFQQVAILPLYTTSMDSATIENALELIKNICRGRVVRKQSLTKCLLTLYHLPSKDLREVAQGDQFSSLMSKMVKICTDLADDDFESFIVNLATLQFKINLWKISKSANYCIHFFLNESVQRCERWPLKVLLKLCDAFTLLGLKTNALHDKLFQLVEENIDELTICNILQTFYLIGENRTAPPNLVAVLESRILDLVTSKEISLVEVATVCTALFKSKSSISSVDFMDALRDFIFASDLSKCPSYHVVGILKVFRQNYYGYSTLFETIGNQVCREMCRYPVQSIMHIVLTFATLHIFHEDLMESAANEIINKIDQCRSKDVAKLLWSFATLNYTPSEYKVVFGALLKRVEELMAEMEKYPMFLISSLLSFAYMNIYPNYLIDVVFSCQFLSHIKAYEEREVIDLRRDLFLLDSCVSLECEENRVNTLNLDYLINRPFSSHMFWDINKELEHRPELREVVDCIRDLVGGDDYFRVHYVLPYMKTADIEICLDANNKPVAPGDSWEGHQQNKQKTKYNSSVHLSDSIISKITGATSKGREDVKRIWEKLEAVSSSNENKYKEEGKMTSRNYSSDEERRLKQVQLPQPLLNSHQERSLQSPVSAIHSSL